MGVQEDEFVGPLPGVGGGLQVHGPGRRSGLVMCACDAHDEHDCSVDDARDICLLVQWYRMSTSAV